MNRFEIIDNYGYKEDYLENLINKTLEKLNIKDTEFCIILIDDIEIREINRLYREKNEPTDVISFALQDNLKVELPYSMLGDIYISIDRMKAQALEYGHNEKRELSFLAIHGLLHLLGYGHEEKAEEKIMFDLQEELLKE